MAYVMCHRTRSSTGPHLEWGVVVGTVLLYDNFRPPLAEGPEGICGRSRLLRCWPGRDSMRPPYARDLGGRPRGPFSGVRPWALVPRAFILKTRGEHGQPLLWF